MTPRTCHPNDPHCLHPECICTDQSPELPDDLRAPLHSLQADVRYLIGRIAQDEETRGMVADSILSRLSQIEEASYRLVGSGSYRNGYLAGIEAAAEAANGVDPDLLKGMSVPYTSIYCQARVDAADAIRELRNMAGVAEQSGAGAPETSVRCGAPAALDVEECGNHSEGSPP